MNDHYIDAVRFWNEGEKSKKLFAYECAMVEGRHTLALAQDCRVSIDTIEAYRNAYKLFYAFDIESDTSRKLWDGANISLFVDAAKRRNSIHDSALFDYLSDAVTNGATVEALRVVLDNHNRTKPEWTTRLAKLIKTLFKLRTDYKSELPESLRERFENAVHVFELELSAISEVEAE
jgi:hypothetical protein